MVTTWWVASGGCQSGRRQGDGKYIPLSIVDLIEREEDGDAKDPGGADDDVLGEHLLPVPCPESDYHQLEMFVINNQAFGYGNLDEVGGDKAEGEEEDGVEDAHGEVEEVLVLLRHVAFVHVEELEAVVPNFCSKDQWTESKGGDEEEECSKENVICSSTGRRCSSCSATQCLWGLAQWRCSHMWSPCPPQGAAR